MRRFKYLLLGAAFAALAFPALAEVAVSTAGGVSVQVYDQTFFTGAQLTTAYDMVQRLPGFVFDDGANNNRGFAGTAGNVLVDGKRPTAKTDDLDAILHRIPFGQVARIEVIRGGAPGIDMQGQSVVANIVLSRETSTSVIATLENTYFGDGHSAPGGSVQFTTQGNGQIYNLTVTRYDSLGDDSAGQGFFDYTSGGTTTRGYAKRQGAEQPGWGINGDASLPLWGGKFGANFTLRERTYNSRLTYGTPLSAFYFNGQKDQPFELGANWDGTVGAAELNVIALQRLEHFRLLNTADDSGGNQLFTLGRSTGESILRSTVRYHWSDGLTLESGIEGAYNTLNGTSSYIANGAPVVLPSADARVNERRGEVFAQASWKIAPQLSLEAGAREEYSHISALGIPSRSLSFLKPRLLLSWSPEGFGQLRLRAEKIVGQLDFANFVATSDLSGNGVSGGNLTLKPDQRWQYEAAYEYHFWDKGAVVLSVMHEDIKDLVDYVPIGGGIDGPGNIPSASNNEYKFNLSLPLDRLGVTGGTFKTTAKWDDGAVTDPVTGMSRLISDQRTHVIQFDYLQDLPSLKSSFDLSFDTGGWSQPTYRINQVSNVRLYSPYVQIAWSYKPQPGLEFNFEADDFAPYHLDVWQENYAGPRNTAPLDNILDVRTAAQPRFFVQMRKTF